MINSNKFFLEKLENHIASNINNTQFGVEELASLMSMSRSNLHRRLKKICGISISSFIREYRLKQAKIIIREGKLSISEASYKVGFNSPSYFNKSFKKHFGYPPSKTPLELTSKNKEKSIIVLPFNKLASHKDNMYLAEGMAEAISRHLSSINHLNVISSSESDRSYSVKKIGLELGITHVLKGSLQQNNNIVRIEIKVFETYEGRQIWADSYDIEIFNVLALQNKIALKVAKALDSKISKNEQSILAKRTSYSGEAYDNYLKGMYYMNHFDENNINNALLYFKKAISIDNTITPAYAAIANFYHMKASVFSASITRNEAFSKAEKYLDLAFKLDKDWHFNHTMKGFQLTFFHWNFEHADKNYQKGLKAKQSLNYFMYRDFLQFENRHKEALKISLTINKKTPFYPNPSLIISYFYNGMYEEGKIFINERLSTFPKNHLIYDNAGFFMLNIGNYERAIELFLQLINMSDKRFPRILSWLGAAYAKIGEIEKASVLLEELKTLKIKTNIGSPAFFVAIIYTALGNKKNALKWLKTAIDDHEMEIPWLVSEPQIYPLHGLPKFDALVKHVGFRPHAYPTKLPKHI